jgi:hypothetical protein
MRCEQLGLTVMALATQLRPVIGEYIARRVLNQTFDD